MRYGVVTSLDPIDCEGILFRQDHEIKYLYISFGADHRPAGADLHGILEQVAEQGVELNKLAFDLLVIAVSAFAADLRISRAKNAEDGFSREIDLYVPVSDPEKWSGVTQLLCQMLGFLSGDIWRFYFRVAPSSPTLPAVEDPLEADFDKVCLFSGGLDSYVGAIDLYSSGEQPMLISHYTDGSASQPQKACHAQLEKKFGPIRRLAAYLPVSSTAIASEREDTQRTRSFLFLALATIIAAGRGQPTQIVVPENGLIALNVPLDPLRIGALSTHTTHPFFLGRFSELMTILSLSVTLVNPYEFDTKGEMLQKCHDRRVLLSAAFETVSCSHYTQSRWAGAKPGHCGYCVPCIIRRASFKGASIKDQTPYRLEELKSQEFKAHLAKGRDIRSFKIAAKYLKNDPRLSSILIHKAGPLHDRLADLDRFAEVYQRGIVEVERLLKTVKTVGAL